MYRKIFLISVSDYIFHTQSLLTEDGKYTTNHYYYYYYYYYYLLQLSFNSVTIVLTLVQTKQIRINIRKRNNTKNTVHTIQNTVKTSTHITKIPTHYKIHTYKHPHIRKPTHTHTHTLQNPHIHTVTHYKTG